MTSQTRDKRRQKYLKHDYATVQPVIFQTCGPTILYIIQFSQKKAPQLGPKKTIGYYYIYIYISGTKPQGLFNSASFSHRRPHFNSDRQILRYSVLLGIQYKFNDDWWITSVPAMRLQKWRIFLNREFLLICV